jgi:hypothetical protein
VLRLVAVKSTNQWFVESSPISETDPSENQEFEYVADERINSPPSVWENFFTAKTGKAFGSFYTDPL